MVESGQMSQEHFINVISELDTRRRRLPGVDPATGPMVPPVDTSAVPQRGGKPASTKAPIMLTPQAPQATAPAMDRTPDNPATPDTPPTPPVPMDAMSPALQKRFKRRR